MLQNCLHQFILIGLCCLVSSNPFMVQQNTFYRQSPAFYHPDKYFASQSRQVQSYAIPASFSKYSDSSYQRKVAVQPYRVWTYQQNNVHHWPTAVASSTFNEHNQQVQSESYNRPIYRKQNHLKKTNNAVSYNKKFEFLENKKKKSQVCKSLGETCYGWAPYIPENCCKGFVCGHNTKSVVGVCEKKVPIKVSTSLKSNIVQRPLTTEELLSGDVK